MNDDGHTSSIRDKILTIIVKPGWKAGTRITFPKEGDQGPNNIPGTDIEATFLLKASPYFCVTIQSGIFSKKMNFQNNISF